MLYALNYIYDNDIDKFPTWIGVPYCDYVHLSLRPPWKEMILSLFPSQQRKLNLNPHPPPTFVFNFPKSFPTLKDELIANMYIMVTLLLSAQNAKMV